MWCCLWFVSALPPVFYLLTVSVSIFKRMLCGNTYASLILLRFNPSEFSTAFVFVGLTVFLLVLILWCIRAFCFAHDASECLCVFAASICQRTFSFFECLPPFSPLSAVFHCILCCTECCVWCICILACADGLCISFLEDVACQCVRAFVSHACGNIEFLLALSCNVVLLLLCVSLFWFCEKAVYLYFCLCCLSEHLLFCCLSVHFDWISAICVCVFSFLFSFACASASVFFLSLCGRVSASICQ